MEAVCVAESHKYTLARLCLETHNSKFSLPCTHSEVREKAENTQGLEAAVGPRY